MIASSTPDPHYSTRLRTALVLTGSGTAAAYHAGVLRALHEAGVKIDVIAGRGAGVVSALFAAVDGGARLWDSGGIWKQAAAGRFYSWRASLRMAGWALVAAGAVLAIPAALIVLAVLIAGVGLLLTLIGLDTWGTSLTTTYTRSIDVLFAPAMLPTIIPRLALLAGLVAFAALAAGVARAGWRSRGQRRSRPGWAGRAIAGPLSARSVSEHCVSELWALVKGAAPLPAPPRSELGRRYLELLAENLGQPGFRELLITVHDLDARRDLVFALLASSRRQEFFTRLSGVGERSAIDAQAGAPPAGGRGSDSRRLEVFDLAGVARAHLVDALDAALAVPLAVDPQLLRFATDGPWRGETHRVGDRPGALARLLEEVAAAGAEQVILVAGSPQPARPHELSASRSDLRGRAGEQIGAFESASLRDALEHVGGRFSDLFLIRPVHNPLGALDFAGVYDERSDRRHTLAELVDRGYEDAYQQFIEPVVGEEG